MATIIVGKIAWYGNEKPEAGDIVMATVTRCEDWGVMTTLDEYAGLTGFIPLSELSQRKNRLPSTSLSSGSSYPMIVSKLEDDGSVVLSRKQKIDQIDLAAFMKRYLRAKSIVEQIFVQHHENEVLVRIMSILGPNLRNPDEDVEVLNRRIDTISIEIRCILSNLLSGSSSTRPFVPHH
jgi:hypothetical protein